MERIRCARAMCRGIGQWIDNLYLLDDRAGPSVGDNERQRIFMPRTNVNEVNVQPIDLGDELRQRVQSRLHLAPVVFRLPITREGLHGRELHALRRIRDSFPLRPLCRVDAPAEIQECLVRNIDGEGADCVSFGHTHLRISLVRWLGRTLPSHAASIVPPWQGRGYVRRRRGKTFLGSPNDGYWPRAEFPLWASGTPKPTLASTLLSGSYRS